MAVNLWFVQSSVAHSAALRLYPEWTQGWFVYGNDLRAAGRHAEAADAYSKALSLRPDYYDAAHNLASCRESEVTHQSCSPRLALRPRRLGFRCRGSSRGQKRLRVSV